MGLNSGGQRLGGKIWIEERQLKKIVELVVEQVPRQAGTSVRADKKAFLRSEIHGNFFVSENYPRL